MNKLSVKHIAALRTLLLAGFAAFLLHGALQAQTDTLMLTLEDALYLAGEQSPDALIARHRFRASYWEYRAFKADYLPAVQLDGTLPNFSRSFRKISVPDGPDIYQYNTLGNYSAQLTLNQKVGVTGGSVFLQSRMERLDNYYDDSTSTTWQSVPVVIGYRQPIMKYNPYRWDKKIEPLKYEKAKRKYLEDREQIAIKASNYFFNLLMAQVDKDIARKNLSNYDTLFRIAQGRFQLGKIAENELLQLELNFLRARAAVDNADLNYENMLFQLRSFLRIKKEGPLTLIPPAETVHMPVSAASAIEEARKNTSTALEFEERMLEAESAVNMAKMTDRFDADLYVEYGITQTAAKFSDAYSNPRDQQLVNLGLSIPLLDWGRARGNIRVAESNLDLERTAIEQDVIDFQQNIFLKVMQFNMQKDQLMIAAKADTVAQKRFDVTQKRYMIGQVNDVLELNNAQIDNDDAKKGYYQSLRNYWVNYYELRKLTLYDFLENKILIFDLRDVM